MESLRGFDHFVQASMANARIPGVSLGLTVGGRRLVCRGYGFRDREAQLPATPMTIYGLASVTKSFTALAIVQLEEQGRLRIDFPGIELIEKGLRFRPNGLNEFVMRRGGELRSVRLERDERGRLWASRTGRRFVRRRSRAERQRAASGRMVW